MKNNNFFQNLPPEIVVMIVPFLPLKTQLQLVSCSKEFYSGNLGMCFYQKAQSFHEAIIKQCMLKEIKHTFLNDKQPTLETLCGQLNDYLKESKTWLTCKDNFIIQKYYFLTYFFKHVLMNNQLVNYANHYEGKKDFEQLVFLVHNILKDNSICSFDAKYIDVQYFFILNDYSNDIPHVYNPWCITIAYGKNDKRKTMALYYTFYGWDDSIARSHAIERELCNAVKKEKSQPLHERDEQFSFDGVYGPYLQKHLKEYLEIRTEEDQSEFEELLESLQKNDVEKCQKLGADLAREGHLSNHQRARLYYHYYHDSTHHDLRWAFHMKNFIRDWSFTLGWNIKNDNIQLPNIQFPIVRLAIVYNMRRGHEQCLYATENIKPLLNEVDKKTIKHLSITAYATQDYFYPDRMYQSGHVFTEIEFPKLLAKNTHVIMNK